MLSISLPTLIFRHIHKDGHSVNLPSGRLYMELNSLCTLRDYLDNEVHRRKHAEISGSIFRSHFSVESERRISHVFISITLHYLNLVVLKSVAKIRKIIKPTKFFLKIFAHLSQFLYFCTEIGVLGAGISHQHPKKKPLPSRKRCRGSSYNNVSSFHMIGLRP